MRTDGTVFSELQPPSAPRVAGVRAGEYTLERELGRGGMATVYLARDAKHDRLVAVKVLAADLTAVVGAERFVQEILVTARLQHPHVLGLLDSGVFGPEAGELAGRPYYVMPYVAGSSLRARLQREGPLPVPEAVRIAREVAGALDSAHRRGVVHRDIKPENVLLDEDGSALVADFGIALAVAQAGGARLTQTGFTVGTPSYMAPEQAMGDRQITARTDVYALGALTYEMLGGEPPFTGPTLQAVIARVLTELPRPLAALRPSVPPHVAAAVGRALEKVPGDRYGSAREFADALGEPAAVAAWPAGSGPSGGHPATQPASELPGLSTAAGRAQTPVRARARDPLVLALAVATVLGGGTAAWLWTHGRTAPPSRAARFVIGASGGSSSGGAPTLTPDGGSVVLPGASEGDGLAVRAVDELSARPIAGTAGARNPFVSPDGRSIGFTTTNGEVQRVPLDGAAAPRTLSTGASPSTTGLWGPGGVVVIDAGPFGGLARIDTAGGTRRPLTRPDTAAGEQSHTGPHLLADGRTVVFTVTPRAASTTASELALVRLDASTADAAPHTRLGVNGRAAVGMVDDHLLYVAFDGSGLLAAPLDLAQGRITGPATVVLRDPTGSIEGATLGADGTLLYTRGVGAHRMVVVDARGVTRPLGDALGDGRGEPMHPRVSPDGRRLSVQIPGPNGRYDIWVYDLATGTPTRLTTSGNVDGPEWTPDGRRILFTAPDGGHPAFWWQPADGSAPAERLGRASGFDATITPDGHTLVFMREIDSHWGIWSARLDGDPGAQTPRPILTGPHNIYMPAISPDGRWLAYVSTESGTDEVYVRPLAGAGPAVRVSDGGGVEPLWASGGRRLYYRTGRQFVAASVLAAGPRTRPTFVVSARAPLFRDVFDGNMPHANYAVMPDGQHFVMFGGGAGQSAEAVLVVNWLPALRAALAAGASTPR